MIEFRTTIASAVQDKEKKNWFLDKKHMCIGYIGKDGYKVHLVKKLKSKLNGFIPFTTYIIDEKIYITSQRTLEIVEYDIQRNEVNIYKDFNLEEQFQTVLYNKKIIILPIWLKDNIYIFDTESKSYSKQKLKTEQNMLWHSGVLYQEKNEVYIPIINSEYLVKLDLVDFEYKMIELPENLHMSIVYGNETDMWMISCERREMYHKKEGILERICIDKEKEEFHEAFSRVEYIDNKLYLFPRFETSMYIYDPIEKKINKVLVADEGNNTATSLLWGYIIRDKKIVFLPWRNTDIFEYDVISEKLERIKLGISEKSSIYYENGIIPENHSHQLQWFLNLLTH